MEPTDDLIYNFLCDLKKKEISPMVRAKLITDYLAKTGKSQRELARELGIPHSTLDDWCRWTNITETEYEELKKQGYGDTDIYRSIRQGTLSKGKEKAIDIALNTCISKMEVFKIKPPFSDKTMALLLQLERILKVIKKQVKE